MAKWMKTRLGERGLRLLEQSAFLDGLKKSTNRRGQVLAEWLLPIRLNQAHNPITSGC
jgi:hypothetical protein